MALRQQRCVVAKLYLTDSGGYGPKISNAINLERDCVKKVHICAHTVTHGDVPSPELLGCYVYLNVSKTSVVSTVPRSLAFTLQHAGVRAVFWDP